MGLLMKMAKYSVKMGLGYFAVVLSMVPEKKNNVQRRS